MQRIDNKTLRSQVFSLDFDNLFDVDKYIISVDKMQRKSDPKTQGTTVDNLVKTMYTKHKPRIGNKSTPKKCY